MVEQLIIVANDPSPNTRAMVETVLAGAADQEIEGVGVRPVRPLEARPSLRVTVY